MGWPKLIFQEAASEYLLPCAKIQILQHVWLGSVSLTHYTETTSLNSCNYIGNNSAPQTEDTEVHFLFAYTHSSHAKGLLSKKGVYKYTSAVSIKMLFSWF